MIGTALGAFTGVVAVQLLRLRRMEFLPGHPGFSINHVVAPSRLPDSAHPPGRALRLVVLGDSTTAGVGVDRAEDSLPYVIARHVADAESRPVHVVSFGWAGARIADLPRSQLPRALQPLRSSDSEPFLTGADAVAIVIGSNDATHNTPPGRFRADLRTTLQTVREAAPDARVVLAGIPAFRGALRQIEPLIFLADQYARLLRPIGRAEARRAGTAYADLAAEVPDMIRGRTDVLSSDHFHPSAVGYAAWADVIADALLAGPPDMESDGLASTGA
jgi:lysophospholipase L1-like esterase